VLAHEQGVDHRQHCLLVHPTQKYIIQRTLTNFFFWEKNLKSVWGILDFFSFILTCSYITVEGLYCKRPIQCLASFEILTLQPLTARRVRGAVRTHSLGGEGGGGSIVRKTLDTDLYSIYVSTLCI
jgi:hypothetical protein